MILTKISRHFGLSQEDETDTVPITAITELNNSNLKIMGLVLVNGFMAVNMEEIWWLNKNNSKMSSEWRRKKTLWMLKQILSLMMITKPVPLPTKTSPCVASINKLWGFNIGWGSRVLKSMDRQPYSPGG